MTTKTTLNTKYSNKLGEPSTNDQPFVLQGMSINRGRCGYYTADFHSKMPVQMSYSSTVSYLLKCRGDQVLEAELMTDQGNVSLSF